MSLGVNSLQAGSCQSLQRQGLWVPTNAATPGVNPGWRPPWKPRFNDKGGYYSQEIGRLQL